MTDQSQAIRAFIVGSFQTLPPSIVDDIASGKVSLLGTVRLLGEYLTSDDEETRTRAVQLLSDITCHFLEDLKAGSAVSLSSVFTVQAVRTLTGFFADKIADGVLISDNFKRSEKAPEVLADTAPRARKAQAEQKTLQGSAMLVSSLNALIVLSACGASSESPVKGFGQEQAHAVTEALFTHVKANDHPQSLRYIIYRLLDNLVAHHRASLKSFSMSTDDNDSTMTEVDTERCEGKPFLQGYIRMVSGEKDPRNLMVLFGVDKVLLTEWDMDRPTTEQFFDITFCYFPITFRPPPDDPYGITSDDLKVALRAAICASPAMAPLGYPLLLEKLSAAGGPAKLDTLRTLIAAMPVYGRAAALANANRLWEALKIEIFHATDDETGDLAADTLTALLHCLYQDVDPPEGVAPKIVHDCLVELEEPGKSLAKAAIKVLACLVKATSSTAYLAVYGFMDQMIKMFADPEDLAQRTPILAGIGELLDTVAKVYRHAEQLRTPAESKPVSATTIPVGPKNVGSGQYLPSTTTQRTYAGDNRPLDPFLSDLLSCLSNGLRSTSYRRSAMLVFSSVVSISILSSATVAGTRSVSEADSGSVKPFLAFDELSFLTREVASLLTSASGDDVREEALCAVEIVSNERTSSSVGGVNPTSRVIEEVVLPILLQKLPDRIVLPDQADGTPGTPAADAQNTLDATKADIRRSLGALSRLCVAPHLFDAVVVKLFTKLELCCHPTPISSAAADAAVADAKTESALRESNIGYARGLVLTLQTMVDLKKQQGHRDLVKYAQTLPTRLVRLTLTSLEAVAIGSERGIGAEATLIADSAALLGTLVRLLDASKQKELLAVLNKTYAPGCTPFVESSESAQYSAPLLAASSPLSGGKFAPFSNDNVRADTDLSRASRDSVALFAAAIVAASPSAGMPDLAGTKASSKSEAGLVFLTDVLQWTLAQEDTSSAESSSLSLALRLNSAYWMAASTVNKVLSDTDAGFIALLDDFFTTRVLSSTAPVASRKVALQMYMWLLHALAVRSSKVAETMLNRVMTELFDAIAVQSAPSSKEDWKFARLSAKHLASIVANADDGITTKDNSFTVRLLWKQKLFNYLLPRLLGSYQTELRAGREEEGDQAESRAIYLVALASLLPSLPSTMLVENLHRLWPLLVRSLSLPDAGARTAAANAIFVAYEVAKKLPRTSGTTAARDHTRTGLAETQQLLRDHLTTIIDALLRNTDAQLAHTPVPTRIAALRTLTSLATPPPVDDQDPPPTAPTATSQDTQVTSLEYHHIYPYRHRVLSTLAAKAKGIDDPSRQVRLFAVDARDAWFIVSSSSS